MPPSYWRHWGRGVACPALRQAAQVGVDVARLGVAEGRRRERRHAAPRRPQLREHQVEREPGAGDPRADSAAARGPVAGGAAHRGKQRPPVPATHGWGSRRRCRSRGRRLGRGRWSRGSRRSGRARGGRNRGGGWYRRFSWFRSGRLGRGGAGRWGGRCGGLGRAGGGSACSECGGGSRFGAAGKQQREAGEEEESEHHGWETVHLCNSAQGKVAKGHAARQAA